MKHSKKLSAVPWITAALLLLLALSLTACGHNSPQTPGQSPELPTPPSKLTPRPSVPYSTNASTDTKTWQQKLTSTPLMLTP